MDKTIKLRSNRRCKRHPVIVQANWYQFGHGEQAQRPRVESRMLLWCRAGRGRLRINAQNMEFLPGNWVLLPWRHHLVYEADAVNPFLVGGIHVIPSHDPALSVRFKVAHRSDDPIADHPGRRDRRWKALGGIVQGNFAAGDDPLQILTRYIVERFQRTVPKRSTMMQLAALLIDELIQTVQNRPADQPPQSVMLRTMQAYVEAHLDGRLSIESLAAAAGCSEASVHRVFRRHALVTPSRWISRLRTERAALLLGTTTLSISEIGRRVGIDDPFHFSRLFKHQMGLSPRDFRNRKSML